MFEGDNLGARPIFEDVIEHSGDPVLVAKSRSLLLSNYAFTRQYQKAFTLANQLVAELPNIQDVNARLAVLTNLSQTMNGAGQIELALKYAQMMADATPPGMSLCYPLSDRVFALSNGGQIDSDSKEYTRAIDTCVAAGQAVLTNTLWLDRSFHMLKEGKPAAALAVLDRIDASIQRSQFGPAMVSEQVQRARAYEKLGEDSRAARAAMAAIAMRDSDTASEWIRDAYRVLYQLAKKQGNASAALQNYEKYVAQNQGYLNDVTARTIAFQTVQQQSLTRKLEAEELSRQNSILKLQQQLDAKAVETGRLYIVLLLIGLTAIVLWLLRLKHSQMRFRHMATRDGLTGILNHQHFIHESERQLRQLERKAAHASMLWMDLDHFKQINDTHGHAAGDAMLRHVVRVCQDHLRPGDLFGRLGGEEFGILLLECESDHAVAIADRIRLAIENAPMDHEGQLLKVSASVGVASSCSAGHALQRLCRRADAALYRAKRGGRNRVVVDTGEEMSAFA
ncbi:MAG: GGDEF domain-containing protein [Xanthomonadaceae bacterium]|nr:GGDEF domain-containing protein [Xanthomonadaceae bacterium]